jgi:CHAT domain-containing protein
MLQFDIGQSATALSSQQQAVAVLTEIGNVREAARAQSRLGRMLLQQDKLEAASQSLEQALLGHRQVGDELYELETLLALSYTRSQTAVALQDAALAASVAQNIDAGGGSNSLQLSFMQKVHAVQSRYIDLLLAAGRTEQAFLAADRIRAGDLQAQFRPGDHDDVLPSLAELQHSLPADTVLLSYFLGVEQSHLWLLTSDNLQYQNLPAADQINAAAAELADNLRQPRQSPGKIDWLSRQLSAMVLQPVASKLQQQNVVVIADGNLQLVPFSLLPMPDDDGNVRPALQTRYAPSASVFAALTQTPARSLQSLLVLADPLSTASNTSKPEQPNMIAANEIDNLLTLRSARQSGIVPDRLPGARLEAELIAAVAADQYRVNLRLGADANRRFVGHGGLRHHDIVHFATHGVVDKDLPALSALLLAPEQDQQPAYLYPSDIRELQLNAELVVLSGCDTGIGKAVAGHGLMSLSRPFLAAGARQVVASLWQVSDQATAELMERFYRNLLNDGQSTQQALQSAQQWMQQQSRWQHPYYWAGFIITGA